MDMTTDNGEMDSEPLQHPNKQISASPLRGKRSSSEDGYSESSVKRITADIRNKFSDLMLNKYDVTHNGPFEVHMEKISDTRVNKSSISEIRIGKSLIGMLPDTWKLAQNLKNLGQAKFTVSFPSPELANKLVSELKEKGDSIIPDTIWIAYIPAYRVCCRVITKDFDSDTSPQEITEYLAPPPGHQIPLPEVINVKNVRKKDPNSPDPSKPRYINTNLFLVTFACTSPPTAASFLGKIIHFVPYVQKVKRCHNCQRFGHLAEQCRGGEKAKRCERCAEPDHSIDKCTNDGVSYCINCIRDRASSYDHMASSVTCPIYIFNRRVKVVMAKLGIGFGDARSFLNQRGHLLNEDWFNVGMNRSLPIIGRSFSNSGSFTSTSYLGDYVDWLRRDNLTSTPRSSLSDLHWPPLVDATIDNSPPTSSSSSSPSPPKGSSGDSTSECSEAGARPLRSALSPPWTVEENLLAAHGWKARKRKKRSVTINPEDQIRTYDTQSSSSSVSLPPREPVREMSFEWRAPGLISDITPISASSDTEASSPSVHNFNNLLQQCIDICSSDPSTTKSKLTINGTHESILALCKQISFLLLNSGDLLSNCNLNLDSQPSAQNE